MNRLYLKISGLTVLLVLALSSLGFANPALASGSPASNLLASGSINNHGPLINQLILRYEEDSTAFLDVQHGTIPAMEWSLSLANFATAQSQTGLATNSTSSYTTDGIAFNELQAPYNNTNFRRAIASLMDYSTLQSDLGPTIQAGNTLYPSWLYPAYNNGLVTNPYTFNTTAAINYLLQVPGMAYGASTGWVWKYNGATFNPQIYYRSDDPVVRMPGYNLLASDALAINLTLNGVGIPGSDADADVYTPSASSITSPGVMGSNYQTVKPPVVNWAYAKTHDTWGMYTYGWIVSFNPTWTWDFFNSQLMGTTVNFINYYNSSMDYYTNLLNYAGNTTTATNAAAAILSTYYNTLPYVSFGWQNTLFTVNPSSGSGWTDFTNLPTLGPSESTGLYYTALNVHPANSPTGGTFVEALHQPPTSLDPLYATNWIWQVDAWQMSYDTPLVVAPTANGVLDGALIPEMANYAISTNNSTSIGTGPGWYSPFGATGIVNGEVVTFNFYQNDTWQDGVQLTANDYNESLYLWNVMGNSPTVTPAAFLAPPPSGILATYIPPSDPMQIQVFFNSSTIWNIYTANINILPWHIFAPFNASLIATSSAAMDTTVPFSASGSTDSSYLKNGVTAPTYLTYEPNLEIGSGPFQFQSWNTVSQVINMTRNTAFYKSNWQAFSSTATPGQSYSFSTTLAQEIYNPGTSSFMGVGAGATGDVAITNATGSVAVLSSTGAVIATYPLTAGSNGAYTASVATTGLTSGQQYELMTTLNYTLFGLPRVSHQFSALNVGTVTSSSSTTSSGGSGSTSTSPTTSSSNTATTSSSTSTPTSGTTYAIIAGVIVVIVVVASVVFLMRRRPSAPASSTTATTT